MSIEILDNVVLTGSVLDRFDEKINTPLDWLDGFGDFAERYVGGLHNLGPTDKLAWAKNSNSPLRIIESNTGREEVWFPNNFPNGNRPSYISLNNEGGLESHQKYNRFLPAIHFSASNLPPGSDSREVRTLLPHVRKFDMWYHDDMITDVDGNPGITSTGVPYNIKDPKVEYIAFIIFDKLQETWEDGIWNNTRIANMRIIFANPEKNSDEMNQKVLLWLKEHCKEGFFPFGDKLFGSDEEEFLFVSDFCT